MRGIKRKTKGTPDRRRQPSPLRHAAAPSHKACQPTAGNVQPRHSTVDDNDLPVLRPWSWPSAGSASWHSLRPRARHWPARWRRPRASGACSGRATPPTSAAAPFGSAPPPRPCSSATSTRQYFASAQCPAVRHARRLGRTFCLSNSSVKWAIWLLAACSASSSDEWCSSCCCFLNSSSCSWMNFFALASRSRSLATSACCAALASSSVASLARSASPRARLLPVEARRWLQEQARD